MLNSQAQGKLVGIEPIENVVVMENHNDAYYVWEKAGVKNRILLHIDAHLDFSWIDIKEPQQILEESRNIGEVKRMIERAILWERLEGKKDKLVNIGNYIYPAIKDGIVNEVYWVIPGSPNSKIRRKEYKVIRNIFRRLMGKNPQGLKQIEVKDNCLVTELYGKRFTVCHLSDLPQIEEAILLDIDVDFFAIDSVLPSTNHLEIKNELPWFLPSQLVDQLRIKKIKTNLVTIAYSVEGGYTPLGYKYLGDELHEILKDSQLSEDLRKIMSYRNQAAVYRHQKRLDKAISEYERVLKLSPDDAASLYNLAFLYLDDKDLTYKASLSYQKAVKVDPTYKTAYNNLGILYERRGILDKSNDEYHKLLKLDPNDSNAHCGLGNLFRRKKMWNEAIAEYTKSIELSSDNSRAHYGLGCVHLKKSKWDKAEDEFNRYIESHPLDPSSHYWLGLIYTKKSQHDYAITELNKAVQLGLANDPDVLIRLGLLYLRKRMFDKVIEVFKKTIKSLPRFIHSYLQGKRRSVMRFLRRWFRKIERC